MFYSVKVLVNGRGWNVMGRVQTFQIYWFIHFFAYLNLLLYHSLYLVVVRFPAFLQVTEIPGC